MAELDPPLTHALEAARAVIIKRHVVADQWPSAPSAIGAESLLDGAFHGTLPEGPILVRLLAWQAVKKIVGSASSRIGLVISGGDALAGITDNWNDFGLVAIEFSSAADGRGFSLARLLRERYGYRGELRAVGASASGGVFTRDQLAYLERVGFDAFVLREGEDVHAALGAFHSFSYAYQATVQHATPLYRARHGLMPPHQVPALKHDDSWATLTSPS